MAPSSPTVARWELALRIKARREELGLTVQAIADHLGFSRNYWSAVENERSVLADDKFDALMKLMEFDGETIGELEALHRDSRQRGWWAEYSGLEDETQRLFGLELGAARIRNYSSLLIPGLLQIEDYTRAVIDPDPMFSELRIDQLVEIRSRRKERLTGNDPLRLIALVSEASLHQQVGGESVHAAQMEHLLWISQGGLPSVEIRLLPFSASPGPILNSATLLLIDLPNRSLGTVAWEESIRPIGLIDDVDQALRLHRCFEQGLKASLSREDSSRFLGELARG